ncbi:uncharacterized protein LOC121392484 [Gigantopelta aegis]|uniref:uncharacterized protein LOC121392484 n=1 Tax=Gigantopelta aegis TaxID=1735272 RepID=UPI001B88C609|nr:uncharacterized protein LOC121392484 [Gigantopelta aegis]
MKQDQSLLFVIRGSLNVSNYTRGRNTIQDNEPYRCYTECGGGPVGLQGKYCYCLSGDIAITKHVEEVRCPGSYDQFCGSDTTMSVYELNIPERLPFVPTNYAACGYLSGYWKANGADLFELKFDTSCSSYLTNYACPEHAFTGNRRKCVSGVCISYGQETWEDAMDACGNKLIKLTTNATQALKTLISNWYDIYDTYWTDHWVGLERHVTRKWINGTDIPDKRIEGHDTKPKCIAVYKSYYGGRIHIKHVRLSCWRKLKAVCQIYTPKTTTVSIVTSAKVHSTSPAMSTTTPVVSTETSSSQSGQTGNIKSTQAIAGTTESQRQMRPKSDSSGMIAGVAVGIIALLVLAGVVVLIWMKRSKRFLFKSAKLDDQRRAASPVHATTSVPNTYEQYDNNANNRIQYESVAYCAQPNTKALRGPIAVSSIDYDLAAADDALQGTRDLADLPNGVRPRDDYELAGPDDAKPETAYAADSSSYACPGDYFELEGPGDSGPETDAYELECPAEKASDEYNTLHETQRDRNVDLSYSHIGAAEITGDLYNTTEPAPHGRTDNETYSHIKGDRFEDEDMYNHTDGSDDVPELYDPEYSHIATQ